MQQRFDGPGQHFPPSARKLDTTTRSHRHDVNSSTASLRSSSPGQSTSRPKSAPHARLGTSSSGQRAAPPGRNDASSTSRSQAFSNMSTMGGSVHSTVSIRPDLDWGEFLARQERFLADREHKLALLEQVCTVGVLLLLLLLLLLRLNFVGLIGGCMGPDPNDQRLVSLQLHRPHPCRTALSA